jgi:hypothetical protein
MKHLNLASRLAALAIIFSPPAMAAPFCITSQVLPPLCIYDDAQQCDQAAARQGAACSANPAELRLTPGPGRFCVVTSSRISVCAYADRQNCARDAVLQHGTCTEAPARAGGVGAPDPYSTVNGY